MVILFIAPFYEAKGERPKGGFNMYLRRVTGSLKELGHTPIIISLGKRDMHYSDNGTEVFFVYCSNVQIRIKNIEIIYNFLCRSQAINRKIAELTQKRHIDIIQFTSIWGLSSCYYGKIPAVMRLSTYSKVYKDCGVEQNIDAKAFVERLAAKRCNAVFAPSNVIATAFSRDIRRKVSVIESPFWNDCVELDTGIYDDNLKEKKYFMFCGRVAYEKGALVIARILQEFLHINSDYYFVCCGAATSINGENSVNTLRKSAGQYKERFIYMNSLPHNLLFPILQHADFVIMPSLTENFSNACIEAMYFERVVIGTDGTSFEQLIDHGKSGLLCKPNDAVSLLAKMNEAAAMNEERKKEMGKLAKERIDKLRPEIVVKKLLRYYQYVINNVSR